MTAPVPKQLAILRDLTTHLEAAEGLWEDETAIDLEGAVLRGRKFFADSDFDDVEGALVSILEAPRPIFNDTAGVERVARKESWTLLLQGWTQDDKKHPSDPAYFLKAAVEKRLSRLVEMNDQGEPLYPDEFRLGGTVIKLEIGQGLVRPPDAAITRYTMFYIPIVIELATDISKPYR